MLWVNRVYVDTEINGQSHGRAFYLILINAKYTPSALRATRYWKPENAVQNAVLFTANCKMLDMAVWWSAPAIFTLLFPSQVSDEKEMLLFSQLCENPSLSKLLLCSLDEAIDFQTAQTAEFHFITLTSLNTVEEGAPSSPLYSSLMWHCPSAAEQELWNTNSKWKGAFFSSFKQRES